MDKPKGTPFILVNDTHSYTFKHPLLPYILYTSIAYIYSWLAHKVATIFSTKLFWLHASFEGFGASIHSDEVLFVLRWPFFSGLTTSNLL